MANKQLRPTARVVPKNMASSEKHIRPTRGFRGPCETLHHMLDHNSDQFFGLGSHIIDFAYSENKSKQVCKFYGAGFGQCLWGRHMCGGIECRESLHLRSPNLQAPNFAEEITWSTIRVIDFAYSEMFFHSVCKIYDKAWMSSFVGKHGRQSHGRQGRRRRQGRR